MNKLNQPPSPQSVRIFLENIDFNLPERYLTLMNQAHEKIFDFEDGKYLHLWPLTEVIQINHGYNEGEDFFEGFFLIGTYEVGEACAIEKDTGDIYTVPFIGDIPDDCT